LSSVAPATALLVTSWWDSSAPSLVTGSSTRSMYQSIWETRSSIGLLYRSSEQCSSCLLLGCCGHAVCGSGLLACGGGDEPVTACAVRRLAILREWLQQSRVKVDRPLASGVFE